MKKPTYIPYESWKAPEHERMTSDMKLDYPRDELGHRIQGREKVLVMDPRPAILIPERKTYKPCHEEDQSYQLKNIPSGRV